MFSLCKSDLHKDAMMLTVVKEYPSHVFSIGAYTIAMDESGRKRGGSKSFEGSVSMTEHARLQKARDQLFARISRDATSPFLSAVRDDILSREIHARSKSESAKKPTQEDILALRADISAGQIHAAALHLLLQVFLKEQHHAQINGKTKQERMYLPDLPTLEDAIRDLTPQAAKKFVREKSATFLLEHHQQMIQRRIREMAGKESLLKPVEFIAETSDPAYYVGKLFYKGSFSKVSIIEENCVGTHGEYFEDSKVNPETGRPEVEIFVVMKRWQHASHEERTAAVSRLLGEQETIAAIVYELQQMLDEESIISSTITGRIDPLVEIFEKVGEKDDSFGAGSHGQKTFSANNFLYRATLKVLNGEKKQADYPEYLPYMIGFPVSKLALLPQFTDIPEMTIEYNVAQNSIEQFKTRAHGRPDQPPARDDPRKNVILSTLWGIARSERHNEKTGKLERRRILAFSDDLQKIFRTKQADHVMLVNDHHSIQIVKGYLGWGSGGTWGNETLLKALKNARNSKEDFEVLGGTIRVDQSTPNEILDALKDLSVNVEIRASATRKQLDRITRVNGMLRVIETPKSNSVTLRNLTYAGQIDVRDVRKFRADKLQEVEIRITSTAEENYFKSLTNVPEIELEPGGGYTDNGLVFVAPKLAKSIITLRNNRRFSRYDCPAPCATKLGP